MIEHTVRGPGFDPYVVAIGRGVVAQAGARIAALGPGRTVVVSDETVAALHGGTLIDGLTDAGLKVDLVAVPPGEASKSFSGLERLLDALLALGLDRSDRIVALGGGVVGDLAGLAAALYMRGLDVIQIPTTLLAQVDSSVGGKTAIDTPRGKNLIGAFHQPRLVLADINLLSTLSERQLRSGWAEVLKHGLICDSAFFDWLAGPGRIGAAGDPAALERAVVRSVEIKSAIVGDDPKEGGRRALLNLGHTFGHAIEAELDFNEAILTHGEAVSLGCMLAFRYSARIGVSSVEDAARVAQTFEAAGLPVDLAAAGRLDAARLVARMAVDKKAQAGRIALVLARGVGEAFIQQDSDAQELTAFLKETGAE